MFSVERVRERGSSSTGLATDSRCGGGFTPFSTERARVESERRRGRERGEEEE